jgi:hypothetical protein
LRAAAARGGSQREDRPAAEIAARSPQQEVVMNKHTKKMKLSRDTLVRLDPSHLDEHVAGGILIKVTESCQGNSGCPTCAPCHLT